MISLQIESTIDSVSTTAAGLIPPVNPPFDQSYDESNGAQPMPSRLLANTSAPSRVDVAFDMLEAQYGDLMRRLAD